MARRVKYSRRQWAKIVVALFYCQFGAERNYILWEQYER